MWRPQPMYRSCRAPWCDYWSHMYSFVLTLPTRQSHRLLSKRATERSGSISFSTLFREETIHYSRLAQAATVVDNFSAHHRQYGFCFRQIRCRNTEYVLRENRKVGQLARHKTAFFLFRKLCVG